jgi:peptidoglycan/xylan/chitin deacetylase (PgdA/CDA1 family)
MTYQWYRTGPAAMRGRAKTAAYRSGLMGAYHRVRNNANLTTVMFHRVLPRNSAAWPVADPHYTVAADIFADCLSFFNDHYNIVSLDQLNAAHEGPSRLPHNPLLITFDDGWADTYDCAADVLSRIGLPAVCFVVSDVLDDPAPWWWQDAFAFAWRGGLIKESDIHKAWGTLALRPFAATDTANVYLHCLAMMHDLSRDARARLLAPTVACYPPHLPRQMLQANHVPALVEAGIDVASHGHSHLPLTLCRDVAEDLTHARRVLERLVAGTRQNGVTALSFPHGRHSDAIVQAAREAGYRFIFTSRPLLGRMDHGRPSPDVHGRIEITSDHITNSAGHFRPERLAALTFSRVAA